MKHLLPLLACALALAACDDEAVGSRLAEAGPEALAALAVTAETPAEDDSTARLAAFLSDRAGTFFYDALAAPADDPAMGFIAGAYRMLDTWRWVLPDTSALGGIHRVQGTARPDFLVRTYTAEDSSGFVGSLINRLRGDTPPRLTERISMIEGQGALLVEIPDSLGQLAFEPVVSDLDGRSAYQVEQRGATLLIARANYLEPRAGSQRPVWLAVRAAGGGDSVGYTRDGAAYDAANPLAPEAGRIRALALGGVRFPTPGAVVVAADSTPEAADARVRRALASAGRARAARSARMARLLEAAPFVTEDERVNDAVAWARLTLDALQVPDSLHTILLSGIPGIEGGPGPGTLYALDAFLATGQWETARRIVTAFGSRQRYDNRIDIFGRAPNEIGPDGEGVYTTADATALFLKSVGDYVRTTGDTRLINPRYWTNTVYGMRGIAEEQFGPLGFLRARPGETWMRAEPRGGEVVTPREGLPVESQGLLYRALRSMTDFATIMGVARRESAAWYADSANALRRKFAERFVGPDSFLYDRYDPAGRPDPTLRPNALFALRFLDLDPALRRTLVRRTAERLAFPYGVATRAQADSAFHPYLRAPGFYDEAAAIHEGAVWTGLSGTLITAMAETGGAAKAAELYGHQVDLLFDVGVVGAVPERLSGHPHPGEDAPRPGGAPVAPWPVAELVRNAYQDFAGVRYASANELVIEPRLPDAWGTTRLRVRLDSGYVDLTLQQGGALDVRLVPGGDLPEDARARVRAFGLEAVVPLTQMQGDTLEVPAAEVAVRLSPDGVEVDGDEAEAAARYAAPDPDFWEGFAWATPQIPDTYPVLQAAAEQRQLSGSDLLRENPVAQPLLTQTDPDGDDWGATSTFTYPRGFPDRVLDATYLEVSEDDSTTYFRIEFASVIPEDSLGYPPVFAALVLNTEPGGATAVGHEAQYDFPEDQGYEVVIYLGDGLRVEDGAGRTLAELPPGGGSVVQPEEGAIKFALPKFIVPDLPRRARVTLLVGARTDGRGIGAFRRVAARPSGDLGGGKVDPDAPNVYDEISGTVTR
ncbi:MAG TPA: amylo-alpha-1,6-glucosidase [Rubricoccaceae bacterium]|nr:amylo-alpha-1,6-glucosidase [Rubricoccaceae bacterium]